uniref:Uncharacterized protein MANES_13G153700 n=1 Tax=Rhizophora mucronata TaxID=61149 RepID=A0A2P2MM47_RHIMU
MNRKISVMDVSKKYGLEYRLLHAITNGHPWYGNWGYEFGAGSFALTVNAYKEAVETLASQSLSQFVTQGQKPNTRLQEVILFYQSLSDRELVNTKDLFYFLMSLIRITHNYSTKVDSSSKNQHTFKPKIPPLWSRNDIQRVEEAMLRVLRAVSGSNWVSLRALRGAVCKVASPDVLDHCLKYLRGKSTVDEMIVVARCNPDSGSCEYRLEPGNLHPDSINAGISSSVTQPSRENLVWDLKFLCECLLHPRTMVLYGPEATRALSIGSAEKLLDCKQFVKDYKPEKALSIMNPLALCLNCEVETLDQSEGNGPGTPPELLILPANANLADLKHEATRAFQGLYLIFRRFQAEEVVGHCGVADFTQVKPLLGSTNFVKVRGRCLGKNGLIKFKMERGIERWTVHCSCGAKDDDGERMLACDSCGVWQHTRCSGIPDCDSVPARFICHRCRGSN